MTLPCPSCGRANRIPARHLADTGRCGACRQALPPRATPLDADPATFDEVAAGATVPVLVDFWAPGCGPCRMAARRWRAWRRSGRPGACAEVNTDEHPELGARFCVRGI
jgi:thioredoxin 2